MFECFLSSNARDYLWGIRLDYTAEKDRRLGREEFFKQKGFGPEDTYLETKI